MPVSSGSIVFLGAARFQGFWDAATNSATGSGLPDGVQGTPAELFATGTSGGGGYATENATSTSGLTASIGDYWQVTGSGTHNVDGYASWNLNDWCIYSGSTGGSTAWTKLAFEILLYLGAILAMAYAVFKND